MAVNEYVSHSGDVSLAVAVYDKLVSVMNVFLSNMKDGLVCTFDGVTNWNFYDWEKELDEIFEEGALKLSYKARKTLYDKYQTIIYNQKPIIYLYSPIRITAIRKKFKNIFPSALSGLVYNPEEIYIEEEGK